MSLRLFLYSLLLAFVVGCSPSTKNKSNPKLRIIIDADANNELDDQHAMAYAFLNPEVFDVRGVSVNNTRNGNGIEGHYKEAERVIKLFDLEESVPLLKGASGSYEEIVSSLHKPNFDGKDAVDFIIAEAQKMKDEKLVLVPLGKLTNIALALEKAPEIVEKVKVLWLGSNYPQPGEYNLDNDTSAVNPVIESGVEFEMVTVRYGKKSGTWAVRVSRKEMEENMKGKGPVSGNTIVGRHGGTFNRFGDYSHNLFQEADMYGEPPARSLFDMVVLAILKNENWGERLEIGAPLLQGNTWITRENNPHKIIIWENFNRDAIVNDFFEMIEEKTRN